MSTETNYKALAGVDNVNHPAHYRLPGGGETIDFNRWQFRVQPPAQISKRQRRKKEIKQRHQELREREPQFKKFLLQVLGDKWRR